MLAGPNPGSEAETTTDVVARSEEPEAFSSSDKVKSVVDHEEKELHEIMYNATHTKVLHAIFA